MAAGREVDGGNGWPGGGSSGGLGRGRAEPKREEAGERGRRTGRRRRRGMRGRGAGRWQWRRRRRRRGGEERRRAASSERKASAVGWEGRGRLREGGGS